MFRPTHEWWAIDKMAKQYGMRLEKVWCLECGRLVDHSEVAQWFYRTYKLLPDGIYPFGICSDHNSVDKTHQTRTHDEKTK